MSRYDEIRGLSSLVTARYPTLSDGLQRLKEEGDRQLSELAGMAGAIGPVDLLLGALIGRSLDVIDGFAHAFDRWNFTVASVLVRLQVDNVLIAHVLATTPDVQGLFNHLLDDQRLSRLRIPAAMTERLPPRDRKGATFTDFNMRQLAGSDHPWIDEIYRLTSSWVHFSAIHYQSVWKVDGDQISARWPLDVEQFGPDFLGPLLNAMSTATKTVTDYQREWVSKKRAAGGSNRSPA